MGDDSSYEEDFSEQVLFFEQNSTDNELPVNSTKKGESPFEILSMDSIVGDVFEMVLKVQTFLNLPTMISARALLAHYKWDYQRLVSEYFESDQDSFFQEAKIENPFKIETIINSDDTKDCKICYTEVTPDSIHSLACGHKFCKTCWKLYLTERITNEGLIETIACPEPSCKTLVDDQDIIQLVENDEVITKYHRSMTNSYVQNNKAMRWCPSPGCCYAAKKCQTAKYPCECKCGHEFCFDCSEYWHEPVNCLRLKQWKSNGDSETFKWIAEHAKVCPNCEAIIEKNGGCNHMTCRICKHEFCWICMGVWSSHRNQACNRFDESQFVGQRELARFNHFRERYVNQLESLRLEGNLYRDIETKLNQMKDEFSMTNNEVKFLRDAIKVLHVSRRTLTYTFVFAYFLKKNNQVEIFEDNQSDLEVAVERLAEYLEQDMNADSVVELKRNIQDSYKYCEKRCNVLMEHIHEAEEKRLWQMNT